MRSNLRVVRGTTFRRAGLWPHLVIVALALMAACDAALAREDPGLQRRDHRLQVQR